VLNYHRVLPEVPFNPFRTIVSVETFERQLEDLMQHYQVTSLQAGIVDHHQPETRVAITFDDGCRDNYDFAFSILRKKGLTATFCVVTDLVDQQLPMWDWEVMCRICGQSALEEIDAGSLRFRRSLNEDPESFAYRVIEQLKQSTRLELNRALGNLRAHTSKDIDTLLADSKSMSWEEARVLRENGMEIGAHGVSHRSLAQVPIADAILEITKSKREIENHLGVPCVHFAFPFGTVRDYNSALVGVVKESGFRTCMLAKHGLNIIAPNTFCLNRITIDEDTNVKYLLG